MNDPEPTDAERYPTLSDVGAAMLRFLKEHPCAPIYRNQSGNRLTPGDIERVRKFEQDACGAEVSFSSVTNPRWLPELLQYCFEQVPHYRKQGSAPQRLEDVPSVDRGHLARNIAAFVPDDVGLTRMINFQTTGTTGHPLLLPSHPVVAASYLAFHKRAFQRFGIELKHGRGQVGVVLLGFQKKCFTYVSVTPTQDESGLAKINLHPDDWRVPEDRARYLEALAPEVLTGDPLSFEVLLSLSVNLKPRALLSTSMSLSQRLRQQLEERFACPVLDVYSLNEAGPIAVFDPALDRHVLLQNRMLIEILDAEDKPVATAERGEITLTGGFNFCLPLVRYRTGDFASLEEVRGEPVLKGLEGRPPVAYRTMSGGIINNIDVTHALKPYPLPQFSLHQNADGSLELLLGKMNSSVEGIRGSLLSLFGPHQALAIETDVNFQERFAGKVQQYTSDLNLQGVNA